MAKHKLLIPSTNTSATMEMHQEYWGRNSAMTTTIPSISSSYCCVNGIPRTAQTSCCKLFKKLQSSSYVGHDSGNRDKKSSKVISFIGKPRKNPLLWSLFFLSQPETNKENSSCTMRLKYTKASLLTNFGLINMRYQPLENNRKHFNRNAVSSLIRTLFQKNRRTF